jgi:hypothetical protein
MDGLLAGRWVAKLVARLLAAAAPWARIQTSLKNTQNGRHKQRSGQHTLARLKNKNKNFARRVELPEIIVSCSLSIIMTKHCSCNCKYFQSFDFNLFSQKKISS